MRVEVINTGTELLLGQVMNSHLAFFGQELFPLGLRIARQVTVPDGEAIREALKEALARADIVLVTGGLGPTTDDLTREIATELLGLELSENVDVLQAITERFARRGIEMTERVKRQAQVPHGATVIPNHHGTAPGLYLRETRDSVLRKRIGATRWKKSEIHREMLHIFLLPGPPRELRPMFTEDVVPILKTLVPESAAFECRNYRVIGLGESNVEALIGDDLLAMDGIELGYCAQPGQVDVRCIGVRAMLERAERIILEKLGAHVIAGRDEIRSLEQVIVENLTRLGKMLATAESCTGGFVANRITNVPGASAVFVAGFVTYANEAKTAVLGVDSALISAHGAVSREVAAAMAEGALRAAGADFALSTTGIAGPGGGTEGKPVGTVFIALAARDGETKVEHHRFPTDRETFKWLVSQTALDLLRQHLFQS
jgi:nicotinamide-nucleotide amidase